MIIILSANTSAMTMVSADVETHITGILFHEAPVLSKYFLDTRSVSTTDPGAQLAPSFYLQKPLITPIWIGLCDDTPFRQVSIRDHETLAILNHKCSEIW